MIRLPKNTEMTTTLLQELLTEHSREVSERYKKLNDVYMSDHEILHLPKKEAWKPDNRIVVNFPKFMVDTTNGFFKESDVTIPVLYGVVIVFGLLFLVLSFISKEVQAVNVGRIVRDFKRITGVSNINNGFKHGTRAVLNELTERVQVGRENNGCREDTLLILSLTFAIQLLPPFSEEMKFRVIVHKNFNLLACLI